MSKFIIATHTKHRESGGERGQIDEILRREAGEVQVLQTFHIRGEYDTLHIVEASAQKAVEAMSAKIHAQAGAYVDIWPVQNEKV